MEADRAHLLAACREAHKCQPVATAYNVGALIVDKAGAVLSSGFSRELPGNTHAEEVALMKLHSDDENERGRLRDATLYTSMEPCSVRLSGKTPCCQRILDAGGIRRVVMAISEPDTFVKCTGVQLLRDAGVEVVVLDDEECVRLARDANRHLQPAAS